ncbi:MAG: UDP-N-acetylglucosamine 2-epimerase (non-hydrolyzing) [Acidobacteria bacterium]|nr:UDP-N-acetylglucosamine 2-epimerase (non-hydrolyzing) [Acidobacteriota bacterium]
MKPHKVITLIGTRQEAIKLMPIVRELNRRKEVFEHTLITTAQHREMLHQVLQAFRVKPDIDLSLMRYNQRLGDFASKAYAALFKLFGSLKPDAVLIQGATTTVTIGALAAFYQGARVGHIEAGWRTFDTRNPFPEEKNRSIVRSIADWHFAPTERAQLNLIGEGVRHDNIFITGNTIIDALKTLSLDTPFEAERLNGIDFDHQRVLLVTAHRRENHGLPLRSICRALRSIIAAFADVEIVFPVHRNSQVSRVAEEELADISAIHLIEPASYTDLLRVMSRCYFVLTDSSGIQIEAPSFNKPVLVLRETTAQPESIASGAVQIVGIGEGQIVNAATQLLTDSQKYSIMSATENPFGEVQAAEKIVTILEQRLANSC